MEKRGIVDENTPDLPQQPAQDKQAADVRDQHATTKAAETVKQVCRGGCKPKK